MTDEDVFSMAVQMMMAALGITKPVAISQLTNMKSGIEKQNRDYWFRLAAAAIAHIDHLPSKVAASKRWNNWKCDPKPSVVPKIDDVGAYTMSNAEWRGISAGRPSLPKNPACFMWGDLTPPTWMFGEIDVWNS